MNRYRVTLHTDAFDARDIEVDAESAADAVFTAELHWNNNPAYTAKAKAVGVTALPRATCPTCGKPR